MFFNHFFAQISLSELAKTFGNNFKLIYCLQNISFRIREDLKKWFFKIDFSFAQIFPAQYEKIFAF